MSLKRIIVEATFEIVNKFLQILSSVRICELDMWNVLAHSPEITDDYWISRKNENWHILPSQCRFFFFYKTFTEMFLEWSSTKHTFFVITNRQNLRKSIQKLNSLEVVWG